MVKTYLSPTSSPRYSSSIVSIMGQPIYLMLDHFPIACFTLTLLTDFIYWQTSDLLWKHFSEWLLLFGLVFGGFQLLVLLIDVIFSQSLRAMGWGWSYAAGLAIVLALATLNSFVHATDGWVGVVPWGLTLSAVTFLALVVTAWCGNKMSYSSMKYQRSLSQ